MKLMLDHVDSPYIRCIGFLYLRYACEPSFLWNWVEPYLYDEEPVRVEANRPETTVGKFVRSLLRDMNYHGTILPRLPVTIEREVKVKLLQAEQIEDRALRHYKNSRAMQHFQTVGSRVRALYGDEENPVTWYDAVVDRVITVDEETREPLSRPKFVVTFPEYGNTEIVSLGEMEMLDNEDRRRGYDRRDDRRGGSHDHDRSRGYERGRHRRDDRKRSRSREPSSERDLMEEVLRRERENSLSHGKSYASRPPSTKASLESGAGRSSSLHPDHDDKASARQQQQRPPPPREEKEAEKVPKKKSPEELAAIQEKKRKLMAKYG
jgi:pre-mRNA-splicing factor 38B